MKRTLMILTVGLLVLAMAAFAWSQPGQGNQGRRGHGGQGGMRGGMMMGMPHGAYVNACDASSAIWEKIGELQTRMHEQSWELFVLRTEDADQEQIEAKVEELKGLVEQMHTERQKLREYTELPEDFQRRRRGGQNGWGAQQAPDANE